MAYLTRLRGFFFFVWEHRNKFALLLQDVKVNLLNCVSIHAEIVRLSDCGTFLCQPDVMFQFDKDDKSWLSVMLY
jgi:hypothetical protein